MKVVGLMAASALLLLGCQPKETEAEKFYARENRKAETEEAERKRVDAKWEPVAGAKAIGLAAISYAGDHNDLLPGPSDWKQKVLPYLKKADQQFLALFVWTFQGGNVTNIEAPAETEIGHIDTPDGKAVVYTDGHAKLLENQ